MSAAAPVGSTKPSIPVGARWRVRAGGREDVAEVASAVAELLVELGGTPPPRPELEATTRALIEDPAAGMLLVAETDGALVGVLAASWQLAIHAAGRYGLIQDLWVHPDWRCRAVGSALLTGFLEQARGLGVTRIEVGLPRERFAGLDATVAFYRGNGFITLGTRMKRELS